MSDSRKSIRSWIARVALGLAGVVAVGVLALFVYQQTSDGPTGPLTGGPFRTGELTPLPVDNWAALNGSFEFELVGDGTSRTAGGILVDDTLYITCDLGYIWGRLPSGTSKNILRTIWWFKDWHLRAVEDGRIRIRKDNRIYDARIARVQDAALDLRLRAAMEDLAKEFLGPENWGPAPEAPPNDVWFFEVLPTEAPPS